VQETSMYASLIGAGVSQLWDLLKSQTQSSSTAATQPTETQPSASASTTIGTGTSGGLSTDVNHLLLDLQSSRGTSASSSSTDATTNVANDLQSVFKDLGKAVGGGHGHHHQPDTATASTGIPASATTAANPFQNLAASLLAYTKSQGVAAAGGSGGLALTA